MRTIIAGSRTITDRSLVEAAIAASGFAITEVVSGCARGVDSLGEQWATRNSLPIARFPADWEQHGKAAGPRRNAEMAQQADALIAIRAGGAASRGTTHMIEVARQCGLKVYVHEVTMTNVKRRTTFVTQSVTICRKCGGHENVNADGLCQQCLAEHINGAGILEDDPDDDLFAAPRQPRIELPVLHPITCVVCGLPSRLPIGQPGDLCGSCRADLVMTRQYVETTLETARNRLHVLIETFEAAVARESEADQQRWQRVIEARVKIQAGAIPADSFQRRWAEALAAGDGLSRILAAHEGYERGCREVEQVERWAARADEELLLC